MKNGAAQGLGSAVIVSVLRKMGMATAPISTSMLSPLKYVTKACSSGYPGWARCPNKLAFPVLPAVERPSLTERVNLALVYRNLKVRISLPSDQILVRHSQLRAAHRSAPEGKSGLRPMPYAPLGQLFQRRGCRARHGDVFQRSRHFVPK